MINMITAITKELDDNVAALNELLNELHKKGPLKKHSVGLIACDSEYTENGTVRELCEALPFDTVGITSFGSAVAQGYGQDALSLAVLTSDDVEFAVASSQPLCIEKLEEQIEETYRQASAGYSVAPSFALVYAPAIYKSLWISPIIMNKLKTLSEVLYFGGCASEGVFFKGEARVIYKGKAAPDTLSLVLVYGDIAPKFVTLGLADKRIRMQSVVVTESEGIFVKRVNNKPMYEYLMELGLTDNVEAVLPFIVTMPDGTRVSLAVNHISEEHVEFADKIPVNSTINVGILNYSIVMETCHQALASALAQEKRGPLLLSSCISRGWNLGDQSEAEMQAVRNTLKGREFFLCYTGGEISPVNDCNGKMQNHFHNYSFSVCIL